MSELNVTLIENEADSTAVQLNRKATDGSIIDLQKDGTTVGSIASDSTSMLLGSGDVGVYFDAPSDRIIPMNMSTLSVRNDAIDIGGNPHRFKDLYLSGGVYLGGTGAANHLDDYEEGTFTATMVGSTSGSLNANSAEYTKIGNTVHVAMTWNGSIGSATFSGQISINGMPFANGGIIHLLKGNYTRMSWASGDIPVINFGTGATSVSLYSMRSNNTGLAWTAATNFVSGSSMWIRINGSYIATT